MTAAELGYLVVGFWLGAASMMAVRWLSERREMKRREIVRKIVVEWPHLKMAVEDNLEISKGWYKDE